MARMLRRARLAREQAVDPLSGVPARADVYFDQAPSGVYPIVAFRTVPCDRWMRGACSPCSYSARSYPQGIGRDELYGSLLTQLEWLLDGFDEFFVQRSTGTLNGYGLRDAPDRPWYMLQLAGESSFFRDAEIPPPYRRAILERLLAFQDEAGVNLHVMIECRPEHLVAAARSGELDSLRPLLRALDVVVNVGYEASDDYLRNVVFGKELSEADFVEAMAVAIDHGLDPGAFVFAGSHILTTSEVLEQTSRTLSRLESIGVFANVMVPNLQSYTLPDLLYEIGVYELPEPYFLLDVAELVCSFRPARHRRVTPFDWFVGGLVSDPPPRYTVLDHPRRRTSDRVTEAIHECLSELIVTLDRDRFRKVAAQLRAMPDYRHHEEDLRRVDLRSWDVRLREMLAAAEDHVDEYISVQAGATRP
jgi:uncharacterized Fe-S cluster-containing MiaB family protein